MLIRRENGKLDQGECGWLVMLQNEVDPDDLVRLWADAVTTCNMHTSAARVSSVKSNLECWFCVFAT